MNGNVSTVQFNLLPDVKIAYIKAQRQKKLVSFISTWVALVALGVLVLLFLVTKVWQGTRLSGLNDEIKKQSSSLKNTPEINKVLTIQNQLGSLSALHAQKPVASRTLDFLKQLVPSGITLSDLSFSFETNHADMIGSAPTLEMVNKFVDTLKFTKYFTEGSDDKQAAFEKVVLSSFGRDTDSATFTITFDFKPDLFAIDKAIKLEIPNQTTTRSETERPTKLFDKQPEETQ